jgi:hypothetical protein
MANRPLPAPDVAPPQPLCTAHESSAHARAHKSLVLELARPPHLRGCTHIRSVAPTLALHSASLTCVLMACASRASLSQWASRVLQQRRLAQCVTVRPARMSFTLRTVVALAVLISGTAAQTSECPITSQTSSQRACMCLSKRRVRCSYVNQTVAFGTTAPPPTALHKGRTASCRR